MRMPRMGSWVRVYWQDASQSGCWEYGGDDKQPSLEVSTGLFRGVTKEAKLSVVPTVSLRMGTGEVLGQLTELQIPVGCVVRIEKLPDIKK